MPETVIDLCSSPVVEIEILHGRAKLPTILDKPNQGSLREDRPPPDNWIELSSDGEIREALPMSKPCPKDDCDREGTHQRLPDNENNSLLRVLSPIAKHKPRKICTEYIDFLSDDFDTTIMDESPVITDLVAATKTSGKRGISKSLDLGWMDLSPDQQKSPISLGATPNTSLLSDPFSFTPLKRQRVRSTPVTSRLKSTRAHVARYPRSVSINETSTNMEGLKADGLALKSACKVLDSNYLLLSSSPVSLQRPVDEMIQKAKVNTTHDDPDELNEAWLNDLVNEINSKGEKPKAAFSKKASRESRRKKPTPVENSTIISESAVSKISSRPTRKLASESAEYGGVQGEKTKRSQQRSETKEDKARVKELEKQRKLKEKGEKSREKERMAALIKVNTLKSKLDSTSEIIVDLPSSMDERLANQVKAFLDGVKAEYSTWEDSLNVVKWRRKTQAQWDPIADQWLPSPMRIHEENHVMCVIGAKDLVALIMGPEGQDLETHVLKLKGRFTAKKIMFLIEGLKPWLQKNAAARNRQFSAAVRSHIPDQPPAPAAAQRRRGEPGPEYVDEQRIDTALMRLHLVHETLIHHTTTPPDTAEWILAFTQHISTIPYKKQLEAMNTSNFCIETGQIDSGKDAKDTYIQMLQQMRLVTPPVAWGIESRYPNVPALIRGLEEKGPLALEQCRKSANKNGAFTDAKIGQAVSRRVHCVFLSTDPWSWEI